MKHYLHLALALVAPFSLISCATSKVQTKDSQAAITPQQAVKALQDGNARFAAGHSTHRNLMAQARKTSSGQHPIAAVLGCIDSRASNELIFDQGIGDIFSARVAGNVLNDDILASLEFATAKSGAKAIMVVGHTRCGAVGGACSGAKLGHVTGLLEKIKPAVRKISSDPKCEHAGPAFEDQVTAENVKQVVAAIRAQSPILAQLERDGKLVITGGIYHLDTGLVEFFSQN
ncbi:MAG: carbonic anhydrase [Verrucomicrobia bacterium]|nr:carbonic anhydrase [Verrucomicrobiota bacterium]